MAFYERRMSNAVSAFIDALLVIIAMALAYLLRFSLLGGDNPAFTIWQHMLYAALLSPIFILLYSVVGIYDTRPSTSSVRIIGRIIACNTAAVMIFTVFIYMLYIFYISRMLIVLFWIIVCILTCTKELLIDKVADKQHHRGINCRRIIVVGCGQSADLYTSAILSDESKGYKLLGNIGKTHLSDVPLLGDYSDIKNVLEKTKPDEIVIALEPYEYEILENVLLKCEETGIDILMIPSYHSYIPSKPMVRQEAGIPLLSLNYIPLNNTGYAFIKRFFDLICSLLLIVITSPIMLVAAIGTKLSSPGPVLFKQKRIGRGRKPFYIYKFRSMRMNDTSDTAWTTAGDPRRTKFGTFMRRYSIDELPQLFNVVKGDMSLVGPRPEIPSYVQEFKESIPLYMVRHRVRPGMTGWAQVNGLRGDTSISKRVQYDLFYIEHWTMTFDLRILLMTPFKGIVNHEE